MLVLPAAELTGFISLQFKIGRKEGIDTNQETHLT